MLTNHRERCWPVALPIGNGQLRFLREVVISFKFRQNRLNGFRDLGVEICHFLYLRQVAYITACTTVQAVILQLLFDVPQRSVLGPILYASELFDVVVDCGLSVHSYADDTQVYISTPASNLSDAIERLATCVVRIREWMASNRLKLNEDKIQGIKLCLNDGMFKLAIRNKFNTAAATILHFVFRVYSVTNEDFSTKFHIVTDNGYPKVIHMSKLIGYFMMQDGGWPPR